MSTSSPRFSLFRNAEYENVHAGTVIFEAGDDGDRMFAVRDGSVELIVGSHVVEVVETDGVFGEMAIIESGRRTATARAATDCQLVSIDEARFKYLVQQTPHFALFVMRLLAERLRRTNEAALLDA